MPYALRSGLSFCIRDGQAYFVDIPNDRYFTLPDTLNAVFLGLLPTGAEVRALDVARLVQLGLICEVESATLLEPLRKNVAAGSDAGGSPPPTLFIKFLLATFWRIHVSRQVSLPRLEAHLRALRRNHRANKGAASLGALSEVVSMSKRLLGDHDRCLTWSAMTAALLLRHGHAAEIILGIATDPFRAHCWVQNGDRLVGDELANVRNFTPILVL